MAITKLGIKKTGKLQNFRCSLIKMLFRRVDLSLKNNQGLTVLQTAAEVGNQWFVCILHIWLLFDKLTLFALSRVLKCLLNFKGKSMMVEELYEDCHSPNSPTSIYLACKAGHYKVETTYFNFISVLQFSHNAFVL